MSGHGNGGICTISLTEYRDVIGSLRYAAARGGLGQASAGGPLHRRAVLEGHRLRARLWMHGTSRRFDGYNYFSELWRYPRFRWMVAGWENG